jgi:hypothetical protein
MPLSSNPNATAQFWLACDAEIPLKDRPVFKVRFITEAQLQEHGELMKQAGEAADDAAAYKMVVQAIQIGVIGWDRFTDSAGQPIMWDASDLVGIFRRARMTESELWELAWGYPLVVRMVRDDRPLSGSPAKSGTVRSAGDIAGAETVPAPAAA